MSEGDLVSIVIPTFNRADLLPATLTSASAQSHDNTEVLVVDDASTDGTEAIVARAAVLDSRIKYYRNETNRGCGGARNRGADEAKGTYICFLDSDDLWHPEKTRLQVQVLESAANLDFVASQTQHFHGRPEDTLFLWNTFMSLDDLLTRLAKVDIPFSFGSTLWRRESFDRIGRFFENQPTSEDLDFFLRAMILGVRCELQPYVLQHYRNHAAGHDSLGPKEAHVNATCIAFYGALRSLHAQGQTSGEPFRELIISVLHHAAKYLELERVDSAAQTIRHSSDFANGTELESVFAKANNSSACEPEAALGVLRSTGLDWSTRPKWWRIHKVEQEQLQAIPPQRRYGSGRAVSIPGSS